MARILLLLTVVMIVPGTPLFAGETITLEQAVASALSNNPTLRGTVAAQEEAAAALDEARTHRRPRIDQYDQFETSDDETTQLPDANQVVIRAEETLFDGRISADVRKLRSTRGAADADLAQRRIDVVLAVRQAYYAAAADAERLAVWTDAEEEFSRLLRFIAPKFNVGSVPEYDYASIRFTIAQYRQNHLDAEQDLSHQLHLLAEAMGADAPAAVAPLPAVAPPPAFDVDTAVDNAVSARPDFRSATLAADAALDESLAARRERWPTLTANGDYGLSAQRARDLTNGWSVGGAFTLPLTDFGGIDSRVRQADARARARQADVDALRLRVRTDLGDAAVAVHTAWAKLGLVQDALPEGKRAYDSSLNRYRTGLAPMTELSDAHDLWVQARVHVIDATVAYRLSVADLDAARGLLGVQP